MTAIPEIDQTVLQQQQGFPIAHSLAFQRVAADNNCVILTRTPGRVCEKPLHEGYAAKSFHIKAKSCDFGASAGFLCLDPFLNKNGAGGALSNLKENYKSMTEAYEIVKGTVTSKQGAPITTEEERKSGIIPLEISEERRLWMYEEAEKARQQAAKNAGKPALEKDAVKAPAATQKECLLTVDFPGSSQQVKYLLIKNGSRWLVYYDMAALYGADKKTFAEIVAAAKTYFFTKCPPKAEQKTLYEGYFDDFCRRVVDFLDKNKGLASRPSADYARYVPLLAMTNPHREYAVADANAYLNAVTGDYDLFAIWPSTLDKRLDTRVAGQRPGISDQDIVAAEANNSIGKLVGNISERIYIIAQCINSVIQDLTKQAGNRVYHSDEAGRPFVTEVDEAAVFAPSGKIYMSKSAADLAELIRTFHKQGYVIFANQAWVKVKTMPTDIEKLVTWADNL